MHAATAELAYLTDAIDALTSGDTPPVAPF
jgi:hypothetical protein